MHTIRITGAALALAMLAAPALASGTYAPGRILGSGSNISGGIIETAAAGGSGGAAGTSGASGSAGVNRMNSSGDNGNVGSGANTGNITGPTTQTPPLGTSAPMETNPANPGTPLGTSGTTLGTSAPVGTNGVPGSRPRHMTH